MEPFFDHVSYKKCINKIGSKKYQANKLVNNFGTEGVLFWDARPETQTGDTESGFATEIKINSAHWSTHHRSIDRSMRFSPDFHLGEWLTEELSFVFTETQIWSCAENPTFIIVEKIAALTTLGRIPLRRMTDWMADYWISGTTKSQMWTCAHDPDFIAAHRTNSKSVKNKCTLLGRRIVWMIDRVLNS